VQSCIVYPDKALHNFLKDLHDSHINGCENTKTPPILKKHGEFILCYIKQFSRLKIFNVLYNLLVQKLKQLFHVRR